MGADDQLEVRVRGGDVAELTSWSLCCLISTHINRAGAAKLAALIQTLPIALLSTETIGSLSAGGRVLIFGTKAYALNGD